MSPQHTRKLLAFCLTIALTPTLTQAQNKTITHSPQQNNFIPISLRPPQLPTPDEQPASTPDIDSPSAIMIPEPAIIWPTLLTLSLITSRKSRQTTNHPRI